MIYKERKVMEKKKRHKWEDISGKLNPKSEKCIQCGMERSWLYGDMQCWEYLDLNSGLDTQRTTLYRPQCEPERGPTRGFYADAKYLYHKSDAPPEHLSEGKRVTF